jgi:opacity protein-like surface antigen
MLRKSVLLTALAVFVATAPAMAQSKRVEASVLFGWTFADGVSGDAFRAPDGNTYNRIDPKDSFKFGFDLGVFATEQVEVGFLYGNQMSTLVAGGTSERELGDMAISTYHGYVAYNMGDTDAKVRPYFMGGMGATHFPAVTYNKVVGGTGETFSETQFSTTWGAGVKVFPSPNVGARFGVQFTPTYIKSDAAGYWCDPYWGCYLVGNAQYANQWDINGGITFRF